MAFIYGLFAAHPWLIDVVLAQESTQANGEPTSAWQSYGLWIILAVMIAVFYFILIRPQRKRAQQHDDMVTKLKKGDEVVTIGGLHGVIKKITEDTFVLEVDKGVRLTFNKSAISKSASPVEEEEEEEEEEEYEEEVEEEVYDEELEEEEELVEEENNQEVAPGVKEYDDYIKGEEE